MRKILYLILISLVFVIPSKVYAFSGSLSLECDSFTKKVGENISCILYGSTDSAVSAVETKLVYDSLLVSNETVPSIWQGDYENKLLLLYTDVNKTNKFELLKFDVTSNEEGNKNLTFSDTYFSDASFVRNQILNPNYTFTFVKEEEQTNPPAEIIDDNSNNNQNNNSNSEEIENPKSGSFIPYLLISLLISISLFSFIKSKNKKIY